MKLKVSTKLPYGKWMEQQTATLEHIMAAAPQHMLTPPPIVPQLAHLASGNGNGNGNGTAQVSVRWKRCDRIWYFP